MDDYPNEDEEFEALYADELEALREQDDFRDPAEPKSRKALKFTSNNPTNRVNILQNVVISTPQKGNSFENDFHPFEDEIQMSTEESDIFLSADPSQNNKKRTINNLFGDIDDIEDDECMKLPKPKKLKREEKDDTKELAMIDAIVELRRVAKEKNDPSKTFGRSYTRFTDNFRDNISYREPKYSSISIRNCYGETVYIRCHSDEYEKEEKERLSKTMSFQGVMGDAFKEIWDEANLLIAKEISMDLNSSNANISAVNSAEEDKSMLWVDLYKPKRYLELLSDERTNRTLLKWLKLWDKIVFNRRPKIVTKVKPQQPNQFKFFKQELSTELDEHGRPQFKVALLCGPPGLGKTTLAHMVADHAGYKVVEINASDDRSTENFKTALENATQMSSVLDPRNRPNCLVFDEIDGAPATSIDFLIKYINGNYSSKPKKGKNAKSTILKRPIICICNDAYVPALRTLRQIAFVVHFPPTKSQRLAERLSEISIKEGIKTSNGALMALSEKSNNDIRSCLSILHFFKFNGKPVTLSDVLKTNVGQKDMQKGLFNVWDDIFKIDRPKMNTENVTLAIRWKKVHATVASFGDHAKVAQGVFENYPKMPFKDPSFVGVCQALEWFCFADILEAKIAALQNYSIGGYLSYAPIVWNYVFGTHQPQRVTFPSVAGEVRTKLAKTSGVVDEILKGMRPAIRAYNNRRSILLDVIPFLHLIISPQMRQVNLQIYTQKEKDELARIVSTMIDYNLNYIQERNQEGAYTFNLDPNIDDVTKFETSKKGRTLSYANRHLVAREIEMEKMRRLETSKALGPQREKPVEVEKQESVVPNHLQKLQPKNVKNKQSTNPMNFLLRAKPARQQGPSSSGNSGDIWFQFKEGYTNAVRKRNKVSEWL